MAIQPAARRPHVFMELLFCSLWNTSCRTRWGAGITPHVSEGPPASPVGGAGAEGYIPRQARSCWPFLSRRGEVRAPLPPRPKRRPERHSTGRGRRQQCARSGVLGPLRQLECTQPSLRQCFLSGVIHRPPRQCHVWCFTSDALPVTPGHLALRVPPASQRAALCTLHFCSGFSLAPSLPAPSISLAPPGRCPPTPRLRAAALGLPLPTVPSDTDPAASPIPPTCSSLLSPPQQMLQPPPACTSQNRGVTLGSLLPAGTTSHPAHQQVLSMLCPHFPKSLTTITLSHQDHCRSLFPTGLPASTTFSPRPPAKALPPVREQVKGPPPAPGPLHMC